MRDRLRAASDHVQIRDRMTGPSTRKRTHRALGRDVDVPAFAGGRRCRRRTPAGCTIHSVSRGSMSSKTLPTDSAPARGWEGNRITSRIERIAGQQHQQPVDADARRPPVGGMPYSSASRKSSSIGWASSSPAAAAARASSNRARCSAGSFSSRVAVADLHAARRRPRTARPARARPASASRTARARPGSRPGTSARSIAGSTKCDSRWSTACAQVVIARGVDARARA